MQTVAVVAGQFYVGSYRQMAKALDRWFDVAVEALINDYRSRNDRRIFTCLFLHLMTHDHYKMIISEADAIMELLMNLLITLATLLL